ncbi:MAG: FAD-dependent oxidoreductase [Cytophagaceae bacterium]|nr:FAD-dependent oxidoreductase [Cytophagaceae bacterium]
MINNDSGKTISFWMDTANIPSPGPLTKNIQVDVCVIGAGMAGLSTAYMLLKEGKTVAVIEDGPLAGGESARTTAHLTNCFDDRYFKMEEYHGEAGMKTIAESHTTAISKVESIVKEENIDCDFIRLDGYLFLPNGESLEILEKELQATKKAGLDYVQWVINSPYENLFNGPSLKFSNQAQFHPMKYYRGLVDAITRMGGLIYTNTKATKIEGDKVAIVKTNRNASVSASYVVVATNTPFNNRVVMHTKQAAYRSYVVGAKIPKGSVPAALYWDTADPYHYIRIQSMDDTHDCLIVGGEDHKTGQEKNPAERFRYLEAWTKSKFPVVTEFIYKWSGQVMEPVDGVGFIGKNPQDKDNIFIITGDSGNGMTHGTIGGMLVTDLIMGRSNPWASLYDPARITLKSSTEFVKENINVAGQYGNWLKPSEADSIGEIPRGSGMVLLEEGHKLAIYKDENGGVHQCSAVCNHLGCVVNWNDTEKSWDCPCHGSRFDAYGKVINAPAVNDLEKIDERKAVKRDSLWRKLFKKKKVGK